MLIRAGVTNFYVGNQGGFDNIVYGVLKKISIVLAYLPMTKVCYKNSVYPEGLEMVPPKFAISYRNKWMIKQSEYVVVYVKRNQGGAAQFYELAKSRGKRVINIAEKIKSITTSE